MVNKRDVFDYKNLITLKSTNCYRHISTVTAMSRSLLLCSDQLNYSHCKSYISIYIYLKLFRLDNFQRINGMIKYPFLSEHRSTGFDFFSKNIIFVSHSPCIWYRRYEILSTGNYLQFSLYSKVSCSYMKANISCKSKQLAKKIAFYRQEK